MEVVEIEKRVREARVCVYVLAARGAWAHSTNGYMRGYATRPPANNAPHVQSKKFPDIYRVCLLLHVQNMCSNGGVIQIPGGYPYN